MLLWLTPGVLDLLAYLVGMNQQLLQLPLDSPAASSNSGPTSMAVSAFPHVTNIFTTGRLEAVRRGHKCQ